MKKTAVAVLIVLAVALGAAYAVCWKVRTTGGEMRALRAAAVAEVRELVKSDPDGVLPALGRFASEKVWRVRLDSATCYLPKLANELKVPNDVTIDLLEGAFRAFVGSGNPDEAGKVRIRKLVTFATDFMPQCPADETCYIRERMLDALFVVDDFDGAVKLVEEGFQSRPEVWRKCTVAKIRAHQAESRGDAAEALKQFLAFGEAYAAEADSDKPEYDPSTDIAYSRSWILGKNAKRCADYCARLGRDEEAARKLAEARKLYAQALVDAQDDEKSLQALKAEIAAGGISVSDN